MASNSYQVFFTPPQDFTPTMHAAGCYVVYEERILILQRHKDKFQGSTWGVPGGKIEQGEQPVEAVMREVKEEVGIILPIASLKNIGKLFVRLEAIDYTFEIFGCMFDQQPQVALELSEHTDFGWFLPEHAKQLPLIQGGFEALDVYLAWKQKD